MNVRQRVLSACLAGAMALSLVPWAVAVSSSEKETVAGGYEIDMGDLPQVHFQQHPEWEELYNAAWNFHKGNIKKIPENLNPELTNADQTSYYVDEAFDNRIFQWDTLFMMMFDKYGIHQFPTLNSMDNFYYHQWDTNDDSDGYISRMIYEDSGSDYYKNYMTVDAINPPLFGWAEWEQYQIHGDVTRFTKEIKGKAIIDRLDSYFQFIKRTRRHEDGPMAGFYVSNGQGNGLDNTPNQDWGGWGQAANDMTLQQAQAADYIAKIAHEIVEKNHDLSDEDRTKYTQMEQDYIQERDELIALIQDKMWSEEGSFFFNAYSDSGEFTNIVTPTGLWALAAGVATEDQAQEMIDTYALNSEKLFRPNGLSTVTYDYQTFKPTGGYWNGSMWSPTSYQWIKGLQEYGYDDLAFQEAVRHVDTLSDVYQAGYTDRDGNFLHTLWENYSSEYDIPGSTEYNDTQPSRINFVGWTGALAIGSMIEDVAGVTVHAPDNEIHWNIHLTEEHGISNLYMNTPEGGVNRVSLSVAARVNDQAPAVITVEADKAVDLVVTINDQQQTIPVEAGTHTYTVGDATQNTAYPTLAMTSHDWEDGAVDSDVVANALDMVSFTQQAQEGVTDGLPNQIHTGDGIYNVNTVGYRWNSSANPTQLRPSTQMQELGLADAQEYVKGAHQHGEEGFMFMAPADTQLRTMYAIVGVQNGTAQLDATVSDASSSSMTETLTGGDTERVYVVEIPYRAAGDDQNILFQYRITDEAAGKSASISLKGLILKEGGREILPAPTQVTAQGGNHAVTLSAQVQPGVTFDQYVIRYGTDLNQMDQQVTVDQLPATVDHLDNYTRYYFTIAGVKDGTEGRRSEVVQAVPEETALTDIQRAYLDYQRSMSTILNGNPSFDQVTGDLNFQVEGPVYGSQFRFYSDSDYNSSGIRNEGTVVRPVGTDLTTSVSVQVTCGETTVNIELPITVLGQAITDLPNVVPSVPDLTDGEVNLTQEGSRDWAQFHTDSLDNYARKDISDSLIQVKSIKATSGSAGDAPFTFTATDGQAQPVNHRGIIAKGEGNGYEITLPYSDKTQVARIYSAVWGGTVTVTAEVNGMEFPVGTVSKDTGSGLNGQCFEIKYTLPQDTDHLTVRVVCTENLDDQWGGCSNVLQAVTLNETDETLPDPEVPAEVEGLSVSASRQPAQKNLTEEGTRDWLLFDATSVNAMEQKQGGTILDSLTFLGEADRVESGKGDTTFAFTDGTKTESNTVKSNVVLNGKGNGISFTVPYSAGQQRIRVHFGAWSAEATLTATVMKDGQPTDRAISRSYDTGAQASGTPAQYQAFTINCNLAPDESLEVKLETTQVHDTKWGNINVGAITLGEVYQVESNQTEHGTLQTGVNFAYPGQTVYLFPQADQGYHLKADSLKVFRTGDESTTVTVTDNTFVMPDYDVTVSATFEADQTQPEADKFMLEYAYNYALDQDTSNLIPTVAQQFEAAMKHAKAVLDNPNATQTEVDAAFDQLVKAIHMLDFTRGDKTMLELLITRADGMVENQDKYVADNWKLLVDALTNAKDVLADENAMNGDIQPVVDALLDAILAQRYKADKSILDDLISKAENVDLSGYTTESVAVFRSALAEAQAIMADESLSEDDQKTVDAAVEQLTAAMDGLIAEGQTQPSNEPEGTDKPQTTNQPEATDKPQGSQQPEATQKPENVPQTGDNTSLGLFTALAVASAGACAGLTLLRRKQRR